MNILELSIHDLAEVYSRKEVSPVEVTKTYLKAIEDLNPKLNAYITVTEDLALEQAQAAEKTIMAGNQSTLTGVPLAIKDLICTKGIATTCASKILTDFVPPFDGTVTAKLRENGAVFLGKANMDEFAMGSSNEHSAFGPVLNPWDESRVPGGSSGGSAAACAAKLCAGALGSDTGGSIRQPAGYCGVVGLKPTYGRVSRFGLVAFASSLDQIGPITRNVTDAALLLGAVAGYDPADSTSAHQPVPDYMESLTRGLSGLKIGVPKEYFIDGLDAEVEKAVSQTIKNMEDEGAELVEISLPHTEYAVAAYYIIAPAEASSNLARYDGVKYGLRSEESSDLMEMYLSTRSNGFGPEVTRRIMIGTYVLSAGYYDAYYKKATQVRSLIRRDFDEAFKKCDIIACPVTPSTAFKIGEKIDDPLNMYLSDIFTLAINLAGIPGISVPCGLSQDKLPIGIQFLSDHFREDLLLKAAYNTEQISEFF
ncbi:MAG: Asp-tRNA(Asn)/Glu-tRNA(Gln) amidotransferase subunit GatA [Deltaproteobacteria bacterium]|nr:Asp-tRNA(Asn)/Glu-tRNA(Gln) amidotransferase subunit GatA [Deltaproteobacteria bacterium]MBW2323407.1 Asp-tRNA(Asn)/Glu-tRNA(Gln) amidotransferase subunit GatA [Deltaproteobacteria bacterium]